MIGEELAVPDTSVVVKWYVPEVDSTRAVELLESEIHLVASDLLAAEFCNVVWKKVCSDELTAAEGTQIKEAFATSCPVQLVDSSHYLTGALELAVRFKRTGYESLYLAVAVAENCRLFTLDRRFFNALSGGPLSPYVVLC